MAMAYFRRNVEAERRSLERRQRQDGATRLQQEAPRLATLRLEIEDHREGENFSEVKYVRPIIVERAPALFEIPCQDPACKEGGHDLTATVLRALRACSTRFEGKDGCGGQIRNGSCDRVLRYVGIATYHE